MSWPPKVKKRNSWRGDSGVDKMIATMEERTALGCLMRQMKSQVVGVPDLIPITKSSDKMSAIVDLYIDYTRELAAQR